MRSDFPSQIWPDLMHHRIAGQEMDDYLYRCQPSPRGRGWTGAGAATVSTQSVMEKALGFGLGAGMGARSLGVGCLAFSDVGSPTQLMIDLELADFVRHMYRDISLDEDHRARDEIVDTIPQGGRYPQVLSTSRFFRESRWFTESLDFRAFLSWG